MILEKVEAQIADILDQAKKMQVKAQQLQRQGTMAALQSEVVVREKFNEFFEQGLTLLGKGIVKGRKIKEALAAEAHRKAANLKKVEAAPAGRAPAVESKKEQSKFIKTSENIKAHKAFSDKVRIKKGKSNPQKSASHYVGSIRER